MRAKILRVPYKMMFEPVPLVKLEQNSALLLIDPQNFLTRRDEGLGKEASTRGILTELDEYYQQTDYAIDNMKHLLLGCRKKSLKIVYTLLNSKVSDGSDISRQFKVSGLEIPHTEPEQEIRPEVAPLPGDMILSKGTYSPFTNTDLHNILRDAGIDTLIIAGMVANYSVNLTAFEAADRDFSVVVVWDACASETLDWHLDFKVSLNGGLIRTRTTREVLEMLEGTRS